MSQELDSMYYSLINNSVPASWQAVAYPSLKPLAVWIKDLNERVAFMANWLINGNPNCFWISGFFFP
jgi:dynein heavy chain